MIDWTSEWVIDMPRNIHRSGRNVSRLFLPGSVSGVFPRALMTYLVYVYGFDWFVHV
jgi:hypothetical protein